MIELRSWDLLLKTKTKLNVFVLLFYVNRDFAWIYVGFPWRNIYRHLLGTVWMLGTKSRSSSRRANILYHWAISLAPEFFIQCIHVCVYVYVHGYSGTPWIQKIVSHHLVLDLYEVLSHKMVPGTKLQFPETKKQNKQYFF